MCARGLSLLGGNGGVLPFRQTGLLRELARQACLLSLLGLALGF